PRINDVDANRDLFTVTSVGAAAHGTVQIIGGGTGITYTPTAGYLGLDTFTYTVTDTTGLSSTSTVTVSIPPPPSAGNRFYAATIRVAEAGTTAATAGASTFDINSQTGKAILLSVPPTQTFTYELNITAADNASALLGVASQAWFDAGGDLTTS